MKKHRFYLVVSNKSTNFATEKENYLNDLEPIIRIFVWVVVKAYQYERF